MNGYRDTSHGLRPQNLIVIDVDDGTQIDLIKLLLHDYMFFLHTTKRHTDQKNRFRLIMPTSHIVKLNPDDHKDFMQNIFDWLPFDCDSQASDYCRKWQTHKGQYFYNDGKLLDILPFIPKTKAAEKQRNTINSIQGLSNLERWFVNNTNTGDRSNQLIKYAYALVDAGLDIGAIENNVMGLNRKLPNPLSEKEILSTIIISASKKIHQRDTN